MESPGNQDPSNQPDTDKHRVVERDGIRYVHHSDWRTATTKIVTRRFKPLNVEQLQRVGRNNGVLLGEAMRTGIAHMLEDERASDIFLGESTDRLPVFYREDDPNAAQVLSKLQNAFATIDTTGDHAFQKLHTQPITPSEAHDLVIGAAEEVGYELPPEF